MSKKSNAKVIEAQATEAQVETPETKKALPTIEAMGEQGYKTKSAMIRYLDGEGFKKSEIAKHLNIRYQHVRNVLTQPLKKTAA